MYAIIQTGGKQYRVAPGESIRVEKLPFDKGSTLEFPNVLAVVKDSGEVLTEGQLADAKVIATIQDHDRAKKIIVFKFKRKKQYKKTIGHRQYFTELKVNEIVV